MPGISRVPSESPVPEVDFSAFRGDDVREELVKQELRRAQICPEEAEEDSFEARDRQSASMTSKISMLRKGKASTDLESVEAQCVLDAVPEGDQSEVVTLSAPTGPLAPSKAFSASHTSGATLQPTQSAQVASIGNSSIFSPRSADGVKKSKTGFMPSSMNLTKGFSSHFGTSGRSGCDLGEREKKEKGKTGFFGTGHHAPSLSSAAHSVTALVHRKH
jgi:hypothetical protein